RSDLAVLRRGPGRAAGRRAGRRAAHRPPPAAGRRGRRANDEGRRGRVRLRALRPAGAARSLTSQPTSAPSRGFNPLLPPSWTEPVGAETGIAGRAGLAAE